METEKFNFDKSYSDYWKNIQQNSSSAISRRVEVPSVEIVDFYMSMFNVEKEERLLDLGCSYGRLFDTISKHSNKVYGIDVDLETINKALAYNYICLVQGQSEATHFASNFFDKIFCWAVFDVVDQEQSLVELNRILRVGGKLLVTGKSVNYKLDDKNAFIAERNAKLKNFPNHFTDVYKLLGNIEKFGFRIVKAMGFENRGDFANKNHFDLDPDHRANFYEYILIIEKIGPPVSESKAIKFCYDFSETAMRLSTDAKQASILDFFRLHKISFGD